MRAWLGAVLLGLVLAGPAWAAGGPLSVTAPTEQLEAKVRVIVARAGERLAAWLGAHPPHIQVTVADTTADFNQAAGRLGGPVWAGALASPALGHILIRSPKQLSDPYRFRPLLVHELAHLYLHAALKGVKAPLWLEEGLAMHAAREGGWSLAAKLSRAVRVGELLPLSAITHRFPAEHDRATLAYAESFYLVGFLMDRHGVGVLSEVVQGLAHGLGVSASLRRATGLGLYATQQAFFDHLHSRFGWLGWLLGDTVLWALMGLAAAVLLVLRWRVLRRRRGTAGQDEDEPNLENNGGRRWPPPRHRRDVLSEAGLGRRPSQSNDK